MDNSNIGHHISQQFNAELEEIRSLVLAMGGLVEEQIRNATLSLVEGNIELAESVISKDVDVNKAEVNIDEECTHIIARRQPAATDLRLVIAVIKTITDLERIGDQAERVARMGTRLAEVERPKNNYHELQNMGDHVARMVHGALDAFARMDVESAIEVSKQDAQVDQEYDGLMRQCLTFMMEDPRKISQMLDIMWAARAIERIGDHAKNICEYVIYLVKGKDVRHITIEQIENELAK
ncbi:MAG: phosphate signaling complex protein PhoU [Gammaproteobacteria bacterium]|nr:phosphate signaling complex protein PhoU [Gammaproteobacteria bacterium]